MYQNVNTRSGAMCMWDTWNTHALTCFLSKRYCLTYVCKPYMCKSQFKHSNFNQSVQIYKNNLDISTKNDPILSFPWFSRGFPAPGSPGSPGSAGSGVPRGGTAALGQPPRDQRRRRVGGVGGAAATSAGGGVRRGAGPMVFLGEGKNVIYYRNMYNIYIYKYRYIMHS